MLSGNCPARTDGFATVVVCAPPPPPPPPPPPYLHLVPLSTLPSPLSVDFVALPSPLSTCRSPPLWTWTKSINGPVGPGEQEQQILGRRSLYPIPNSYPRATHHTPAAALPGRELDIDSIFVQSISEWRYISLQCSDAGGGSDSIELHFWHRPLSAP